MPEHSDLPPPGISQNFGRRPPVSESLVLADSQAASQPMPESPRSGPGACVLNKLLQEILPD